MFGANFIIKSLAGLEEQAIRVKPMQCSKARHQLSTCRRCIDHCPTKIISWGSTLQVNNDKCDACGICATACPNGVFELNNRANDNLSAGIVAGIKHSHQIAFACTRFQQKLDSASARIPSLLMVPCLGRLDESILIGCVLRGARSIWLVNSLCDDCTCKSGWDIAQQIITASNKILEMLGISPKISTSPHIPEALLKKTGTAADTPPQLQAKSYSRRDFLKSLTRGTAAATILAASSNISGPAEDDNVQIRKSGLPFYLPKKRISLLESLKGLGKPAYPLVNSSDLPFQQLIINEKCTGCGMCAYFCPTNALQKTENNGKSAIAFEISRCTRCNLCIEICYLNAISTAPDINPQKILQDEQEVLFEKEIGDSETASETKN